MKTVTRPFFELSMPICESLKLLATEFAPTFSGGDRHNGRGTATVSICSGLHGDELDGLYICHRVKQRLSEIHAAGGKLTGKVRLIPVMNPLGADVSHRFWPFTKIDINRQFPGDPSGESTQRIAAAVFNEIKHSDLVIDIHSSNLFVSEVPQVRILDKFRALAAPYADYLDVDIVWLHDAPTVIETTLSFNLNQLKIPTLVIECGISHRLTLSYIERISEGILNLLRHMKLLQDGTEPVLHPPKVATDSNVIYLNADRAGLFVSRLTIGESVRKGALIGEIIQPALSEKVEEIRAPESGLLFTLKTHPVSYPGSLLGRIVTG